MRRISNEQDTREKTRGQKTSLFFLPDPAYPLPALLIIPSDREPGKAKPGLEPRLLDPEMSELTMRPLCLELLIWYS